MLPSKAGILYGTGLAGPRYRCRAIHFPPSMNVGYVQEIAMADHVAVIVEALRRTQAKVAFYLEPGRDHRRGLQEIGAIVEDEQLLRVLGLLATPDRKHSLVPDQPTEEVVPAPPLSR
jgi:hypothetical protein